MPTKQEKSSLDIIPFADKSFTTLSFFKSLWFILCSFMHATTKNVLMNHDTCILKSFLTESTKKTFLSLGKRNYCIYFGIVIFWLAGKNCILNNEKWNEFPESPYRNSNFVSIIVCQQSSSYEFFVPVTFRGSFEPFICLVLMVLLDLFNTGPSFLFQLKIDCWCLFLHWLSFETIFKTWIGL